ncbi:MAG: ClbS/DfsB family four-helix bundle protein [Anaerolineae bacterium]|nr:ClbS/DfsB family four-helix bundle protein [Anaerolineae bacterium]
MHHALDKRKLLDLIQADYDFIERTIRLVPPDRMEEPGAQGPESLWSVKDTIAHLTAWMRRSVGWLAEAKAGQPPTIPAGGLSDANAAILNEQTYQANRDRPVADVLADFRQAHQDVIAGIEALSETDLFGLERLKGIWREPPFALVAGNTYEHYPLHIEPLRRWLQQIEKSGQLGKD